MATLQVQVAVGRLGPVLEDFRRAMGFTDADLAAWLELPVDRVPSLGREALPDPADRFYPLACSTIAAAMGCDAWSLGLIVLWGHGRR